MNNYQSLNKFGKNSLYILGVIDIYNTTSKLCKYSDTSRISVNHNLKSLVNYKLIKINKVGRENFLTVTLKGKIFLKHLNLLIEVLIDNDEI